MLTREKLGGEALAKLAMNPTPDCLKDKWKNFLRLQLSGFVQVWDMDARSLASPPSGAGQEVPRCDFAVFQNAVLAGEKARQLSLVEFKNSAGGGTADKVREQLNGGLNILRELAEDGKLSYNALTPILVHGRILAKTDAFALGRIRIKPDCNQDPVPVKWCKSGSVLKDGGVIESVE